VSVSKETVTTKTSVEQKYLVTKSDGMDSDFRQDSNRQNCIRGQFLGSELSGGEILVRVWRRRAGSQQKG